MMSRTLPAVLLIALLAGCAGTSSTTHAPGSSTLDYTRPLSEGQPALRMVGSGDPAPDLAAAWRGRDLFLRDAMDHSLRWFEAPSSRQWFPIEGVSHERARASVKAFRNLLEESRSEIEFVVAVQEQFDIYMSVGCDDAGTVLFTGYFAPDFRASSVPTLTYNTPLYTRPSDLATDPADGRPLGRRLADGTVTSYPTRREIEETGMLTGDELVYVRDSLDAYTVHVNGSARLRMDDGTIRYIGYAGKTDQPYTGLGQSVLDAGLIPPDRLSLRRIRRLYDQDPDVIDDLIARNDCYVFFREYDGGSWPSGSLGVPVTTRRSVATDKKIFPRGGVVLAETTVRSLTGDQTNFAQFMVDQDTGGAIRAPGRADLFMGVGPTAGIKAGGQYAPGRLYYLFLKPEQVANAG